MQIENKTPSHLPKILLIYTGGTIGMVKDPKTQALQPFDFSNILDNLPEVNSVNCELSTYSFSELLDSSNINPSNWVQIAEIIEQNYDKYDGFVVLHGTDTMSYTTSALSFMFSGLKKPVIFTGSQLPIGHLRTDAKENLITAIELASATNTQGNPIIQEVCLYFQHELYRANRSTKINAEQFNAFASPNFPPLASSGVHLSIDKNILFHDKKDVFYVNKRLETDILLLHLYPGMSEKTLKYLLSYPDLKGVIMFTYGSGNAPSAAWFTELLAGKIAAGIPVVNVTQCIKGAVSQGDYAVSQELKRIGVISGHDITKEAAITKMMYLLGQNLSGDEVGKMFEKSLKGEINTIIA